jgi:predicted N-acetyltransferase YhbS
MSSTVELKGNASAEAIPARAYAPGFIVSAVTPSDYPQIGRLHDRVFGPGALTRTAYRIREGLPYQSPFCRVTRDNGVLIAAIRFTPILIGGRGKALMLGPLAVVETHANQGHARRLIAEGIAAAKAAGIELVVLVGDAPYYGKLGFVPVPLGQITMPGPVDPTRLLAYLIDPTTLARTRGMVSPAR